MKLRTKSAEAFSPGSLEQRTCDASRDVRSKGYNLTSSSSGRVLSVCPLKIELGSRPLPIIQLSGGFSSSQAGFLSLPHRFGVEKIQKRGKFSSFWRLSLQVLGNERIALGMSWSGKRETVSSVWKPKLKALRQLPHKINQIWGLIKTSVLCKSACAGGVEAARCVRVAPGSRWWPGEFRASLIFLFILGLSAPRGLQALFCALAGV